MGIRTGNKVERHYVTSSASTRTLAISVSDLSAGGHIYFIFEDEHPFMTECGSD